MKYKSPVFCEHANECPTSVCQCPKNCACRESMCSEKSIAEQKSQELAELGRDLKASARVIKKMRIAELEDLLIKATRLLRQTSRELDSQGAKVKNLIAAVEAVYPYLTDELITKLEAAVGPLKGAK